jgi:hypothetical protein
MKTKVRGFKRLLRSVSKTKATETILKDDGKRPSASDYKYPPREFNKRQENFYQNLLQLYRLTKSKQLPVYYTDSDGNSWHLDRGCVAIAVHDGFLAELKNNSAGFVDTVTLNW